MTYYDKTDLQSKLFKKICSLTNLNNFQKLPVVKVECTDLVVKGLSSLFSWVFRFVILFPLYGLVTYCHLFKVKLHSSTVNIKVSYNNIISTVEHR